MQTVRLVTYAMPSQKDPFQNHVKGLLLYLIGTLGKNISDVLTGRRWRKSRPLSSPTGWCVLLVPTSPGTNTPSLGTYGVTQIGIVPLMPGLVDYYPMISAVSLGNLGCVPSDARLQSSFTYNYS